MSRTITAKEIELFLISTLALYLEVMLIRWLPSTVQIVAYFTNVILLTAFLGLGLGCLRARTAPDLLPYFPLSLLALTGTAVGCSGRPISAQISGEHLLGFYSAQGIPYLAILFLLLFLTAWVFLILGQALGKAFGEFPPLTAYSINIAGSIAGVALFWLMSYLMTPPLAWFGAAALVSAWWFVKVPRRTALAGIAVWGLMFLLVGAVPKALGWSPYYRIDVARVETPRHETIGYSILANQAYHQYALDFSAGAPASDMLRAAKAVYTFPYRAIAPKDVLVIGAGSGNDVAVALAEGAERVDAVEIDPMIAWMGRAIHPNTPYQSEKVRVTTDDARSFLNRGDAQYDLIVFGYLDAHRLLSSFSTVRIDNFIYTTESFEAARRRLRPGGVLAVTYLVFRDWVVGKLDRELRNVFGEEVAAFSAQMYEPDDTVIFLAGSGARRLIAAPPEGITVTDRYRGMAVPMATDDWPYLYLRQRSIPPHYGVVLAGMVALTLLLWGVTARGRLALPALDPAFFCLGAGFMLMETKSITRFSLLYGSTWTVNTVVILSILLVILAANALVGRWRSFSWGRAFAGLFLAVLLEAAIDPSWYLSVGGPAGRVLSSGILAMPLFFSDLIFAALFRQARDPVGALSANLWGAMAGGLLEYSAMVTGFRALSWIVMAVYGLAYLLVRRRGVA